LKEVLGVWNLFTSGRLLAHPVGWSPPQLAASVPDPATEGSSAAAMARLHEVQSMWDMTYIKGKEPC